MKQRREAENLFLHFYITKSKNKIYHNFSLFSYEENKPKLTWLMKRDNVSCLYTICTYVEEAAAHSYDDDNNNNMIVYIIYMHNT